MKKIDPEFRAYLQAQVAKGGQSGASAQSELLKFSEDQARDSNGEFASGAENSAYASAATEARSASDAASREVQGYGEGADHEHLAQAHADAANAHDIIGRLYTGSGKTESATAHFDAAGAHRDAAAAHLSGSEDSYDKTYAAADMTDALLN
jgi:hypothetical protein